MYISVVYMNKMHDKKQAKDKRHDLVNMTLFNLNKIFSPYLHSNLQMIKMNNQTRRKKKKQLVFVMYDRNTSDVLVTNWITKDVDFLIVTFGY